MIEKKLKLANLIQIWASTYIFSQLSKFIKDLNENMDIIYDAAFTLFNHE